MYSNRIRKMIARAGNMSKASHIGSALSVVEILETLYFRVANISKENYKDPKRDRIILSKGHGSLALYCTLALKGIIPVEDLDKYLVDGGILPCHIDMNSADGLEASTGSLGHGAGLGEGFALANRLKGINARIFVIIGDGELQEGSVFEALNSIGSLNLNEVTIILDNNKFQASAKTDDVVNVDNYENIFDAFGFNVRRVNGHDIDELENALTKTSDRPVAVIADTLKGKIEVRMAKNGEKLFTLDGKERTLSDEDIVISDGERAIGLAGVMGGLDTEITDKTKNVLIESAIFDGVKIRKTSKEILRSEASSRFEKGLDPNRTYMALERAAKLLEEYADGEVVGGIAKFDKADLKKREIEISFKNINDVLGMKIPKKDVLDVFRRLKFDVYINGKKSEFKEQEKDLENVENITVSVPRRRGDISIKEDLIEEVGRIYGVDNIVGRLPEMPMKAGSYDKVTRGIRNKMVDLGLNETLSYILVNDKEAKYFTKDDTELVKLLDPMTEERNTLRHSILPSLLKIYEYNKARSNKDVAIFEIGKAFYKRQEEYGEINKIAGLMTGDFYLGVGKKQVDFYIIKGIVEELLDYLGYGNRYSFVVKENQMPDESRQYLSFQSWSRSRPQNEESPCPHRRRQERR